MHFSVGVESRALRRFANEPGVRTQQYTPLYTTFLFAWEVFPVIGKAQSHKGSESVRGLAADGSPMIKRKLNADHYGVVGRESERSKEQGEGKRRYGVSASRGTGKQDGARQTLRTDAELEPMSG